MRLRNNKKMGMTNTFVKPPLKGEVAREMTAEFVNLRKVRVTEGFVSPTVI